MTNQLYGTNLIIEKVIFFVCKFLDYILKSGKLILNKLIKLFTCFAAMVKFDNFATALEKNWGKKCKCLLKNGFVLDFYRDHRHSMCNRCPVFRILYIGVNRFYVGVSIDICNNILLCSIFFILLFLLHDLLHHVVTQPHPPKNHCHTCEINYIKNVYLYNYKKK